MGFFNKFKNKFERSVNESEAKSPESSDTKKEVVVKKASAKAEKEKVVVAEPVAPVAGTVLAHRILSHAYVTEKTATLASTHTYTFVVPLDATKLMVKQAITEAYGVTPASVRTIRRDGKMVRFGRTEGQRKDWKKAMVTLPEGKTLPIYE